MRTSILCEFNKLRRSKILFVALFGIVMILVIVAAQGFYAGGDTVYGMEPEWFLTGVQSLGTMYAIPGIIALFGCYVFCRETQEDTLKSLQIIPIDIPAMLLSKILLVLIFSAALYLILFLSAFIVEAILHVQVLSVGLFGRYLTMYCVEGLSVFIATLPVICIVIKTGQDYWMGLLIAEIYSFITIFVGNLGTVSKLYPIIAALTLSGYYESNYIEKLLSLLSMIACLLFSAFLIKEYSKKME